MNNILLVTADSLRADYCGFQGGPSTTPFLSTLAEESVVYENAVAPGPRTASSVPVFMTGEPFRDNDGESNADRLERVADHVSRFQTLPERLADRGYTTGAVTANPWTTTATGFDTLFDEFIEIGSGHGEQKEDRSTIQTLLDFGNQWRKRTDWFAQWPAFYDEVRSLTEELPEPWFVWVFLLDTHSPYIIPRQDLEEANLAKMYYSAVRYNMQVMRGNTSPDLSARLDNYLQESYRDAIRSVDRFVESIVADVPDDTSLLFHSDHGEAFDEHGTYGHQETLYEENIQVPLLVHNGSNTGRIDAPLSLRRIPDQVVDLAEGRFQPTSYADRLVYSTTEFSEERVVRAKEYKAQKRDGQVAVTATDRMPEREVDVSDETRRAFADAIDAGFATVDESERVGAAIEASELENQ